MTGRTDDPGSSADARDRLVRELVRAIRGRRSQEAMNRRLGKRGNPLYAWESGRRRPSAAEVIRLARAAGVPIDERIRARLGVAHPEGDDRDREIVRALVAQVCAGEPLRVLAQRTAIHRDTIASWAQGRTEPRMAEVLALFGAIHFDPLHVIALFVDPSLLPSARAAWKRLTAMHAFFEAEPIAMALFDALDTEPVRAERVHAPGSIGRRVGLGAADEQRLLARLADLGLARVRRGKWTRTSPRVWLMRPERFQRFYAFLAADRIGHDPTQRRGLHLGAVHRDTWDRLVDLGREYVRRVQQIVAEGPPGDRVIAMSITVTPLDAVGADAIARAHAASAFDPERDRARDGDDPRPRARTKR